MKAAPSQMNWMLPGSSGWTEGIPLWPRSILNASLGGSWWTDAGIGESPCYVIMLAECTMWTWWDRSPHFALVYSTAFVWWRDKDWRKLVKLSENICDKQPSDFRKFTVKSNQKRSLNWMMFSLHGENISSLICVSLVPGGTTYYSNNNVWTADSHNLPHSN